MMEQLSSFFCVFFTLIIVVVVWLMGVYNALVRHRNHVTESWADIDAELKRRHDLIPNLVSTVKGYAAYESQLLESIVQARNRAQAARDSQDARIDAEGQIVSGLRSLLALTEAYPDLNASEHFLALQRELANTEDRIQASRRFYNSNVRDLNNRVESFPSNLIANVFGFKKASFFELGSVLERETPRVNL